MTGRPRLENPRRLPRHLRNEDIPSNTFTPRAYQVELLDSAIKRNSIICLGSGTGKTFIAVMVLRELSHQVRPPLTQNGKRSVFLVNNESHLSEKAKIIEHHTDLNIGSYTLDQNTDGWSSEKWGQEINTNHILVTTPKILYSLLEHGHLNCPQLNVVVFEDCHLVTGDEFHNKILDNLHSYPDKEQPKILGLTSCFLSSKCQDPLLLEKSVVSLEEKLKCTAETSSLVISERYGIKPKEIIFECDNYEDTTGMVESLGDILERSFEFLQECNIHLDEDEDDDDRDPTQIPKTAISESLNILYKLGPWCAAHIAQMLVTQIEKIDKHERVSIHKTFLKYCATQLRLISTVFEKDFKPDYDVEELLSYTTPKVRKLINHLRKFKPNCDFMIISSEEMDDGESDDMDNDSFMSDDSDFIDTDDEQDEKSRSPKLIHIAVKKENEETEVDRKTFDPLFTEDNPYLCGIVFVDHRYVALALNKFIEEVCSWDEQLCFIKSHQISAHSQKGSAAKKEGGKIYKKQEEILRKFRLQDINLLISTNVLEDGIDLPKCNLVVKFDSPKDYRSYCQSKGRARARDAEYVLMVEEYTLESFRKDIQMYKGIEQILIGRGRSKDDTEDDIDVTVSEDEEHLYEDILPPYSAGEGYPSVSLSNSLALINRYCAKLPSDAFTHLTPHCTIQQTNQDGNPMYIAKLRLPINSPIKNELQGILMPSKTLAKKAVALKMCEMLHKAGELDEQLMPVGKELFILEEEDNTEWSEEDVSGEARPGTTKRKQYYVKKIASALLQSHPKTENNLIYILNLKLTKPISDDQNTRGRKIYDPEENNSTFGLVTCNEIPQIPQFPVYTRSGEVTVSISLLKDSAEFTDEELSKFKDFHEFVFANVLRLEKDPMDFSPDHADVGYLIVPLLRDIKTGADWMVDFDFMEKVEKSKFVEKRNIYDSKQDKFEFVEAEYDDAVVMPAYRNIDQPQHFYVAEIRYDLNPISPFPSPELYKTFSEYYNAKYGLTITNLEQPLLDVDHTSARLNLLTPRYMNQKGVALPTSSAETKKARRENLQQKQILVPELCEVHVFPASLWRIAVCLPAVMYRTNYLLVAEEIRIKIALETGIGVSQIPEDFSFPPLDFGFQQIETESTENVEKNENEIPENVTETETVENVKDVEENKSENATETKNDQECPNQNSDSIEKINIDECKSTQDKKSEEFSVNEEEKVFVCNENGIDSDSIENMSETESSKTIDNLNQIHEEEETSVCKESNKTLCKNCGAICERNGYYNNTVSRDQSNFQENSKMTGNCPQCNTKTNKDIVQNNGAVTKSKNEICENELIYNVDNLSLNEIPNVSSGDDIKPPEIPCNQICDNNLSHTDQESKDSDPIFNGANNQVSMETQQKCNTELEVHNNSEGKDQETAECDVFSNVTHFGKDEKNKPKPCSPADTFDYDNIPEPLLSLDEDIDLGKYIGPSPCTILQALTMSNANDFFSLERLETIGDSFLKYAITVYLYCSYPGIHEGKLSYLRSKQVSNCNLYRLGKRKCLAECMISTKFEPYENWLPPGFVINEDKRKGPVPKVLLAGSVVKKDLDPRKRSPSPSKVKTSNSSTNSESESMQNSFTEALEEIDSEDDQDQDEEEVIDIVTGSQCLIPYSLQTLHSIPDKSIADCVESLIGCYLTSCGKKAALMFMSWLGLKVLPRKKKTSQENLTEEVEFYTLKCPSSPLLTCSPNATDLLNHLLIGYEALEKKINYKFNDRSYLLQAFTHASYHYNTVTDCYQRLEFLGDAILDYVITRHLYEDSCKYSPGVLTDLRSALVNNNIFAALAVKWDFHKYFKAISPSLFHVIDKFVSRQKEREDEIDLDSDNEDDEEEGQEKVELEVPKALGDIFESLAGAIYLDSGMSLDVVWRVYYRIMKPQIDKYLKSIPKSPVRELLEMEPETAKFERPERTLEGKIRVTVNVVGKGQFTGIGRNYRIAKSASAKKALRCIKTMQVQGLI